MLRAGKNSDPPLAPQALARHFGHLFTDPTAPPEAAPALPIADFVDITPEELAEVLSTKFKGGASSGMCPVPSQVVRHMAGKALVPLAQILNHCLRDGRPPTAWRSLKLVPLFKNKGAPTDPDNYRALAVGHPVAKLAMAVVTARMEKLS